MSSTRTRKFRRNDPPVVLISPSAESRGVEFLDNSISLSEAYPRAITTAGGLPLALPGPMSQQDAARYVELCDGLLLTGGDDICPAIYRPEPLPARLRRTVGDTSAERDLWELTLIDEVFRQRKPLFAICRGHQLVNVALGGTLIVDIQAEIPSAGRHNSMDRKNEIVHEAQLTEGSLLARITGKRKLGVSSTHHQAVGRVADPLRVTAVSDDGIVEAMELKQDALGLLPYFLTVQFHPERLADRHREHRELFRAFVGACLLNRNGAL